MTEIFAEDDTSVALAPDELDARKALVEFDETDVETLADLSLADREGAIVDRLLAGYETRDDVDDEQAATLADFGTALTATEFDADAFAERGRFGAAHDALGLSPSAYLASHARWVEAVLPALRERLEADIEETVRELAPTADGDESGEAATDGGERSNDRDPRQGAERTDGGAVVADDSGADDLGVVIEQVEAHV